MYVNAVDFWLFIEIGAALLPPVGKEVPPINDEDIEEEIDEEFIDDGVFKLLLFIDVPFL